MKKTPGTTGSQDVHLFSPTVLKLSVGGSLWQAGDPITPRMAGAAAHAHWRRVRMEVYAPARTPYCEFPVWSRHLIRSPRVQIDWSLTSQNKRRWVKAKLGSVMITKPGALLYYVQRLARRFSTDADIRAVGLPRFDFRDEDIGSMPDILRQLCLHEARIRCISRPWHAHYLVRLICECFDLVQSLTETLKWYVIDSVEREIAEPDTSSR